MFLLVSSRLVSSRFVPLRFALLYYLLALGGPVLYVWPVLHQDSNTLVNVRGFGTLISCKYHSNDQQACVMKTG